MSRNFPAGQFEQGFLSQRLCNWEVPAVDKLERVTADTRYSTLKARTGRTQFIADDRGYVQTGTGTKKISNSFTKQLEVYQKTQTRWPQENPAIIKTAAATMGFKGIQTDYLPVSTVPLRTVEIPGCREHKYL